MTRRNFRPGGRSFDDPKYVAFRAAVRKRDNHCCRRCGSKVKLQVHHIRRWADAPLLRFQTTNGITLCKRCHNIMQGKEAIFAALCMTLLRKAPPQG